MKVIDFLRGVIRDREEYHPEQDPTIQRTVEAVRESTRTREELNVTLGKQRCAVNFYEDALFFDQLHRHSKGTPTA